MPAPCCDPPVAGRCPRARRTTALLVVVAVSGCAAGTVPSTGAGTTSNRPPSTAAGSPPATAPAPATTPAPAGSVTVSGVGSASVAAAPPNLRADRRNAWAFAPLACPDRVTVEGRVRAEPAWSTSKVLVAAAFVRTVGKGDPNRLTSRQRGWVARALRSSDMAALLAMAAAIPGGQARPMNAILRSIGDRSTVAPARRAGLMRWTIREQVRFMAALAAGRVVNAPTSRYLLSTMRPVPAHAWGLGTIRARAWKGGWLRPSTQSRQMGIVGGYAVALITDAVGPAVRQSDGDWAHVAQLNRLARLLAARLAAEAPRACRG